MKAGMAIAITIGILLLLVSIGASVMLGASSFAADFIGESGAAAAGGVAIVVLIAIPIMVIVGGAIARSNPKVSRFLIGLPGLGVLLLGLSDPAKGVVAIAMGAGLLLATYLIHREYTANSPSGAVE